METFLGTAGIYLLLLGRRSGMVGGGEGPLAAAASFRFDAAAGAMNRVGFDYVVEKVAVGYFSRDYSVSSARASRARDKCGHEDDPLAAARQRP